jgi:hypothetical protein
MTPVQTAARSNSPEAAMIPPLAHFSHFAGIWACLISRYAEGFFPKDFFPDMDILLLVISGNHESLAPLGCQNYLRKG